MNYYQMQNQTKEVYPAIILDSYILQHTRSTIRKILFWFVVMSITGISLFPFLLENHIFIVRSYIFFLLSTFLIVLLIEMMYRSYYFTKTKVDIRVLKILHALGEKKDITTAFLQDELGQYVMIRLGFTYNEINKFIQEKTDIVTKKEFEIIENDDDEVSFAEFGISLMHFDSDLKELCRRRSITHDDFKQTLEWVSQLDKNIKERERWWTLDSLLRFPSLGKNLSFGQIYYLERLGHNILQDTAYIHLGEKYRMYKNTVLALETILSKNTGGNIMLTARESYVPKDALASLAKQIQLGKVLSTIENKRLYILETNTLLSSYEEPVQFEQMFHLVLNQASRAGNVILILPDFAEFIDHAGTVDVDVKSIIREALQSTNLQIIATSNERLFHQNIETDLDLMTQFEKVHVPEFNQLQTISVLEDQVMYVENKHNVFFTYQAIKRIVESADRYFAEMSLLDKGVDLLHEVVFFAKQNGHNTITQELVDTLVSSKTGLSLGTVSEAEAQKMSHIKEDMMNRIVDQEIAVESVVDAMMRARAGFANPKKPLASFLFVGPTGVGKTETAKVLADLFFGDENQMLRSDMSEYSDQSAVQRIIGDSLHAGIFASKVREKGSGVLLLDEFEKASSEVHDLFLQIIDEGFFTDGRGERVVMRNFIIIATSNAGSHLWNTEKKQIEKQTLLDHIVSNNIFKTELINRFDEVVVFNQLQKTAIEKIAYTTLTQLTERLDSKGLILKETPELLKYIVEKTNSSQFGARELHRIIKKEIESKIAQALVLGDLFEGDTISFTVIGNQLEIQKYS